MERHDGIAYELVQALDAPVLQMVEQLPNVVQFFATHLPVVVEPVIEVPNILPFDVLVRTGRARSAAGGTAGGSADDRILLLVAAWYGAAR